MPFLFYLSIYLFFSSTTLYFDTCRKQSTRTWYFHQIKNEFIFRERVGTGINSTPLQSKAEELG